jgi:hypothetical protein
MFQLVACILRQWSGAGHAGGKQMHIGKTILSIASILTLGAAIAIPGIRAGDEDQMTKFNFNFAKPVQIPGQVLEPGSYWFMIKDAQDAQNDAEKNIIAIYNADKTKHVADVPARPAQRKDTGYGSLPTKNMDGVELQIAPGTGNRPATLIKWFYPGTYTGHQFVYPEREQKALDEGTKQTVVLKAQKHEDGTYGATLEQ